MPVADGAKIRACDAPGRPARARDADESDCARECLRSVEENKNHHPAVLAMEKPTSGIKMSKTLDKILLTSVPLVQQFLARIGQQEEEQTIGQEDVIDALHKGEEAKQERADHVEFGLASRRAASIPLESGVGNDLAQIKKRKKT